MVPYQGAQKCFLGDDGFMRCNAIMRRKRFGDETLYATDSGRWWKFPGKRKRKAKKKTRR